jgi:hypothetical protein
MAVDEQALAALGPEVAAEVRRGRRARTPHARAQHLVNLGSALIDVGAYDDARLCAQEARALYTDAVRTSGRHLHAVLGAVLGSDRATRTPEQGLADCDHLEGYSLVATDRPQDATPFLQRARDAYVAEGDSAHQLLATEALASSLRDTGDGVGGRALLVDGRDAAAHLEDEAAVGRWVTALLAFDAVTSSEPELLRAQFTVAGQAGDLPAMAGYAHALALAHHDRDELSLACDAAESACRIYDGLPTNEHRLQGARVRWLWADLCWENADRDAALGLLAEAEARMRELAPTEEADSCASTLAARIAQHQGYVAATTWIAARDHSTGHPLDLRADVLLAGLWCDLTTEQDADVLLDGTVVDERTTVALVHAHALRAVRWGDPVTATELLERALAGLSEPADRLGVEHDRALLLMRTGQRAEAEALLGELAVEADRHELAAIAIGLRHELGALRGRTGDTGGATAAYTAALDASDPDDANRADCLANLEHLSGREVPQSFAPFASGGHEMVWSGHGAHRVHAR